MFRSPIIYNDKKTVPSSDKKTTGVWIPKPKPKAMMPECCQCGHRHGQTVIVCDDRLQLHRTETPPICASCQTMYTYYGTPIHSNKTGKYGAKLKILFLRYDEWDDAFAMTKHGPLTLHEMMGCPNVSHCRYRARVKAFDRGHIFYSAMDDIYRDPKVDNYDK